MPQACPSPRTPEDRHFSTSPRTCQARFADAAPNTPSPTRGAGNAEHAAGRRCFSEDTQANGQARRLGFFTERFGGDNNTGHNPRLPRRSSPRPAPCAIRGRGRVKAKKDGRPVHGHLAQAGFVYTARRFIVGRAAARGKPAIASAADAPCGRGRPRSQPVNGGGAYVPYRSTGALGTRPYTGLAPPQNGWAGTCPTAQ